MPPLTPENVLIALGVAIGLLLIANAILLLLARGYHPERTPDEVYRTKTADGWTLAIARYKAPPRPEGSPNLPPVICCHGLGANAVSLDMAEEISLPRYLRSRGFDVWLVDLRGCGESASPPEGRSRYDYSFDELAAHDVRAAIELVKRETGAPRVAWVGHSMGGAVLYAHLEQFGDRDVQAAAVIASPSGFVAKPFVTRLSPFARVLALKTVHHELWSRIAAPIAPLVYGYVPLVSILINARNGQDRYVRTGLAYAMANPSTRLLKQFAHWSLTGELRSVDGSRTYFRELTQVRVPWLAIAGSGDRLVPPANVRAGFEKLGSPEKQWLELGVANGHAADYGHCDLVLGPKCRDEVYRPIADFFLRYPLEAAPAAGPAPTAAATTAG